MVKSMKELQTLMEKRQALKEEQERKIEKARADIELTKKAALDAMANGDVDAYAAARAKRERMEDDLKVMTEFKEQALDKPSPANDPAILKIGDKYSAAFDKAAAPKVAELKRLKNALFVAYLDAVKLQAQAVKDRDQIRKQLSEEYKGTEGSSKRPVFKAAFDPVRAEVFAQFFEAEIAESGTDVHKLQDLFIVSRRAR